jgi:hypothetical protein
MNFSQEHLQYPHPLARDHGVWYTTQLCAFELVEAQSRILILTRSTPKDLHPPLFLNFRALPLMARAAGEKQKEIQRVTQC